MKFVIIVSLMELLHIKMTLKLLMKSKKYKSIIIIPIAKANNGNREINYNNFITFMPVALLLTTPNILIITNKTTKMNFLKF